MKSEDGTSKYDHCCWFGILETIGFKAVVDRRCLTAWMEDLLLRSSLSYWLRGWICFSSSCCIRRSLLVLMLARWTPKPWGWFIDSLTPLSAVGGLIWLMRGSSPSELVLLWWLAASSGDWVLLWRLEITFETTLREGKQAYWSR